MLRLKVLVMAIITSFLDWISLSLLKQLDCPRVWLQQPFPEVPRKSCIHSPLYMHWGKPPVLSSPKRKFLCNPMLYPSLIIMSTTVELETQSHHHHNPFEDELSTAFTDQIKKQLSALNFSYHPQPEAHRNIPGLFLNSILLHAAR